MNAAHIPLCAIGIGHPKSASRGIYGNSGSTGEGSIGRTCLVKRLWREMGMMALAERHLSSLEPRRERGPHCPHRHKQANSISLKRGKSVQNAHSNGLLLCGKSERLREGSIYAHYSWSWGIKLESMNEEYQFTFNQLDTLGCNRSGPPASNFSHTKK